MSPVEPRSLLNGRAPLVWAFCASALVAVAAQWPGFVNPWCVNDDVRQQLFWMQRWRDPGLYPPDLLNEYARLYVSWGVQGLYRLGVLAFDPLFFSKLVAVGLSAWLGALFFATGRALKDEGLGLTLLCVSWFTTGFMEYISGGLARAFAPPLLLLFLYALLARSRSLALGALLAQALFIPYILLLSLGVAAAQWLAWRLGLLPDEPLLGRPGNVPGDALAAGLALGLAVAWQQGLAAAGFGPLPWAGAVAGRPEFTQPGRLELLPHPSLAWELIVRPWESLAPFKQSLALGVGFTVLALPLLGLGLRRADWKALRPHAPALAALAAASLGLYCVARLAAFKLFVPSRYLEYSVHLFLCLGAALALDALLCPRLQRMPRRVSVALLCAALVLGGAREYGCELYDYSGGKALYAYAQTTPRDARFAGHPEQMDNLLTFGQRNVYVSFELAHPWSVGYWRTIGPRLERFTRAYWSAEPEDIRRFCAQEGIDFLVADRRHFEPGFLSGKPLFEPYGELIRQRLKDPRPFALLSGVFSGVAVDADILVFDMRPGSANRQDSAP